MLGVGVALAMNKEFPLRGLVRALILLPYVAPVISVVFSWQFIFDPVNGIFMHWTVEVLHIFKQRFNLIGHPQTAILVAILFNIWKNFPFTYLMVLSKLQAISDTYYEAADLDGASAWQKFWHVTLPELYFVLGAIVILRMIWNLPGFRALLVLFRLYLKAGRKWSFK